MDLAEIVGGELVQKAVVPLDGLGELVSFILLCYFANGWDRTTATH